MAMGRSNPAPFAHIRRCKIDRDGFTRISEPGVQKGRFDALAAFLYGGIRHANCNEVTICTGWVHVYFDVHSMRFNALNGGTEGSE